jgi:plasmid stability protein
MTTTWLQIRIAPPLKEAAQALAERHERSLSGEVRYLLARELEREPEPTVEAPTALDDIPVTIEERE